VGSRRFLTVYDFARNDADAFVRCTACGHERRFDGMQLAYLFGGPLSLDRARKRFRCTACGNRGAKIAALPKA
jgi:hypothetical protein